MQYIRINGLQLFAGRDFQRNSTRRLRHASEAARGPLAPNTSLGPPYVSRRSRSRYRDLGGFEMPEEAKPDEDEKKAEDDDVAEGA